MAVGPSSYPLQRGLSWAVLALRGVVRSWPIHPGRRGGGGGVSGEWEEEREEAVAERKVE